jgi:hypothetical protein
MNVLSRLAFTLTIISAAVAFFESEWRGIATMFVVAAAFMLWITREIGHRRNQGLRSRVLELGGSLVGLDSKVERNHPARHAAAAIAGQGELATWDYATLIERMRRDGHIS